jgi:phosphohistidine phosphatase
MKHLLLLRHAKSSWANPELDDIDRPLNKRGKRASGDLAGWFRETGWAPDEVLCSAARRTRETCERLGLACEPTLRDDLYDAQTGDLLAAIQGAAGDTVLMVGHNPAIGALARLLAASPPDHARFPDYPTGALTILRFDLDDWARIQPGSGEVVTFLTPHDLAPTA